MSSRNERRLRRKKLNSAQGKAYMANLREKSIEAYHLSQRNIRIGYFVRGMILAIILMIVGTHAFANETKPPVNVEVPLFIVHPNPAVPMMLRTVIVPNPNTIQCFVPAPLSNKSVMTCLVLDRVDKKYGPLVTKRKYAFKKHVSI